LRGTPEVKYAFIHDYRDEFEVQLMCELFDVSRSGYYSWTRRDITAMLQRRLEIMWEIKGIFAESDQTYGSPRIYHALMAQGHQLSVGTVARYMRNMGIAAVTKKRFKVCTTDSKHSNPIAPNLLDQKFVASRPDEIWLSDLTYISTAEGWLYLVTVMDLCTRKIVGWNLSTSLVADGTIAALDMAVKQRNPPAGLIFHSDRGVQYACEEFRARLTKYAMTQSMSRKGNCYDNAPMESFFHTLKTEHVYQQDFEKLTNSEASISVFRWIECFYNRKRLHSSLGYQSPVVAEEKYVLAQAA
jgi:putative transposase